MVGAGLVGWEVVGAGVRVRVAKIKFINRERGRRLNSLAS